MKILSDEATKQEEDKSYRIWEKEGGNLGVIRRRLVAQASQDDTVRQIFKWGDEDCPHNDTVKLKVKRGCIACWQELLKLAEVKK